MMERIIRFASAGFVAVVISDLQFDEGDGIETIAQMKAAHHGLRVIILSGVLIDPRVAGKSIARDVDAYLPKPGSLAGIVEEVRRLTGY